MDNVFKENKGLSRGLGKGVRNRLENPSGKPVFAPKCLFVIGCACCQSFLESTKPNFFKKAINLEKSFSLLSSFFFNSEI